MGNAEGYWFAGGLCGVLENGTISRCYAASGIWCASLPGSINGYNKHGTVTACFYEGALNPLAGPQAGVTPLTTAQFTNTAPFTAAGWDFVGEAVNGIADLWHMPYQASGYPMLYWQRDITGDITGSYGVNLVDFNTFAASWLSSSGDADYEPACNLDNTGDSENCIDTADLAVLSQCWLEGK